MVAFVIYFYVIIIILISNGSFLFVKSDLSAFETAGLGLESKEVNFDEVFKHVINTCKIKERASDRDIEKVVNGILPSTMVEKCFVACWLESFHVIKNRRFFRDQYIKLSTYDQDSDGNKQKVLRQIFQTCKFHSTCNQDRCELAYLIVKCIHDGAAKLNIDPKQL